MIATPHGDARRYFQPHDLGRWRWAEGGSVVVREHGWTIAFRAELVTILERLAPEGLPQFESILHLLDALREGGDWVRALRAAYPGANEWMDNLIGVLDQLHALPPELRTTAHARAELAALAFERRHPVNRRWYGNTFPGAIAALADPRFDPDDRDPPLPPVEPPRSAGDVIHSLDALHALWQGLADFDPVRFAHRLRTGLDLPVRPAPLPALADDAATTRGLIDDERDHLATMVTRLARDLGAATHLPRRHADPDPSATGGLADLGQRGPLERLLASELAHDDATLAARIATNEALYWQRETSVTRRGIRRVILVDIGLRMWGVPRAFAAAVALALATGADRGGSVIAGYARGTELEPVDLGTPDGLTRLLEAQEPDLDASAALAGFATLVHDRDPTEAVLVTVAGTVADSAFAAALAQVELPSLFVCAVDRSGRLDITERTPAGTRRVRSAEMSLDGLFAEPPPARRRLIAGPSPTEGPEIQRFDPFPLYLPHRIEHGRAWYVGPDFGLLAVTRDRRLMHWRDPARGGQQLCDRLPPGEILAHEDAPGEGPLRLIVGRGADLALLSVFRETLEVWQEPLPVPDGRLRAPHSWVMHAGRIYGIAHGAAHVYDSDAHPVGSYVVSGSWDWGRIWRCDVDFHAMSFAGGEFRLERLRFPVPGVVAVFERFGREGLVGVTAAGELVTQDGTKRSPLERAAHDSSALPVRARLADDGVRLSLYANDTCVHYDLSQWQSGVTVPIYRGAITPDLDRWIARSHLRTPRTRFKRIYINGDGSLALESRRGKWWSIALDDDNQRLEMQLHTGSTDWPPPHGVRPFEPWTPPFDSGLRWQVARWDCGTTAWVDSRGLLHLAGVRSTQAEVTIALGEGRVAAWASNGLACGPEYFTGRAGDRDALRLVIEVLEPILARSPR